MNSIDIQRIQFIKDCKTYTELERQMIAVTKSGRAVPDEILQAIKDKREEFKILEDENEI